MENEQEIWSFVPIEPFNEIYMVSSLGRVKSTAKKVFVKKGRYRYVNEKLLKPNDSKGYQIVALQKDKEFKKRISIHRLVSMAFIPNPDNKPQVNHIDGNKVNNRVSNLEWVTASENTIHAHKNGLASMGHLQGENNPMNGKMGWKAKLVLELQTGLFFDSAKEAAIAFGINPSTLRGMLNGTDKNHTSFIYA